MSFINASSVSASRLAGCFTLRAALLVGALCPALSACDEPIGEDEEELALTEEDEDELVLTEEQEDALAAREGWHSGDNPKLLSADFNFDFDELPTEGWADRTPWPGYYWPTYNDSINYRWAGSKIRSPAAKYGAAFGRAGVESAISRRFGLDSVRGRRCDSNASCGGKRVCARRRGASSGECVESWMGICHAWAPAAIMEREPKQGITYNGVRFEISDLKALISVAYTEGLSARMMSLRCNGNGKKYTLGNQACKDTNAGSFHVVLTNMLGIRGTSFIEDRVFDREVWNHPVIGYRVTRNQQVSAATANDMISSGGSKYRFNPNAVELRRMRTEVRWINEAGPGYNQQLVDNVETFTFTDVYDYIIELDGYGRVIGGEWVGSSKRKHPDFLWLPMKKREATVAGVIRYAEVEKLMQLAGGGQ